VALAVSANLFGDAGPALASVAVVQRFRLQSGDRDGLRGGTGVVERLRAGAQTGGDAAAAAGANYCAADDFRGYHDASRYRPEPQPGLKVLYSPIATKMKALTAE
jgi:hypothetical protein